MPKTAPHKRGAKNHNAKLDLTKVRFILGSSKSNAALARELGVSAPAVSNVRTGRTWGWIDADWDDDEAGDERVIISCERASARTACRRGIRIGVRHEAWVQTHKAPIANVPAHLVPTRATMARA